MASRCVSTAVAVTQVSGLTCRVPVSLAFSGCLQKVSVLDGILLVQSPSLEGIYLNPVCSRKSRLASHVSGSRAHLLPDFTTHASCCGLLTHTRPRLCYQIWKKRTEGQCVEKQCEASRVGCESGSRFHDWWTERQMSRSLFLYPKCVFKGDFFSSVVVL